LHCSGGAWRVGLSGTSAYRPSTAIGGLGDAFYDVVAPARFPRLLLRFRNDRAASEVGLDGLSDAQWIAHFGRFEPLPGNLAQPLALRYHGHQFRSYNPDLGDGRGFLFAQLHDRAGRLLDLGTKGSGKTPWSRFGDGRLTLKGGVRELLATEMLEALGVSTSRTFSLIETGEALHRNDEPSPARSAVLVRLSHGHIRYGTFQRLAWEGDAAAMRRLTLYVLEHLLQTEPGPVPEATLLTQAVSGAARLVAQWHAAGFVHGVLNTDNISLTSESFDYGPWRFVPRWDPRFTAAYFDASGLYAFGRQAEALAWNLGKLASALAHCAAPETLLPCLDPFAAQVAAAWREQALWRLGLERGPADAEEALIRAFEQAMAASGIAPDKAWFAFRGGRVPADPHPAFLPFVQLLHAFTPKPNALSHPYWHEAGPVTMYIDEVEALWSAIADREDWAPLATALAAVRRMGEAHRTGP
jgi:uncharacterized protein YdiU (UPF0061 family)